MKLVSSVFVIDRKGIATSKLTFSEECIRVRVVQVIRRIEQDEVIVSILDISYANQCMRQFMQQRLRLVALMAPRMVDLVVRIEPHRAVLDAEVLATPHCGR